jgi:antitoxin (DNA-binding transcriptional repressor) of toxin-antitoxin stability system
MESHISAADAASSFSEVIERVRSRGEIFVVEREGEPICKIEPVSRSRSTLRELAEILRTTTPPDDGYFEAVEQAVRAQGNVEGSPWER